MQTRVLWNCVFNLHYKRFCTETVLENMTKPKVIFVLGGPGAGKGTQCSKIVEKFGYVHLSAGDLLRAEKNNPESREGKKIADYIKNGKIVPVEITCGLLRKAIFHEMHSSEGKHNFLIDGFPRNADNLKGWESAMSESTELKFVLFFDCSQDVCVKRIMKRSETSGRTDDNMESLRKRFDTYLKETTPIINHYEKLGKVRKVDATKDVDEVFEQCRHYFELNTDA